MCRYAFHNYRDHFACFACRKAFKYWQWEECDEVEWQKKARIHSVPREIICPECKAPMVDMGLDFKAPPQSAAKRWEILEALSREGFTFHGCGCDVGFTPPTRMRDVAAFIREHRRKSEGEILLDGISSRAKQE